MKYIIGGLLVIAVVLFLIYEVTGLIKDIKKRRAKKAQQKDAGVKEVADDGCTDGNRNS